MTIEKLQKANELKEKIDKCQSFLNQMKTMTEYNWATLSFQFQENSMHTDIATIAIEDKQAHNDVVQFIIAYYEANLKEAEEEFKNL